MAALESRCVQFSLPWAVVAVLRGLRGLRRRQPAAGGLTGLNALFLPERIVDGASGPTAPWPRST